MLNHLSNSNGTLSMESISEIIDHQTLSRQLVEDTSDLMVQHSIVGRTPSPASSVTAISSHEGVVDGHEVATSSSVVLSSDSSERNNMVIVHTIIDQNSSSYQTQRIQHQNSNHHHQQHRLFTQHLQHQSPRNFLVSDNTLDTLSVGSTSVNTMGHIIAVKQEHKLVHVSGNNSNNNGCNNNNNNNICNNHKHHKNTISEDDKNNCNLGVVLNELAPDVYSSMDSTDQHSYKAQVVDGNSESHHHHSSLLLHQQLRSHHNKQSSHNESLSVIVQKHEDSHDSTTEILCPSELGVSVGENSLQTSSYQTLTSVVNVEPLSPPGFSPTSAYATLTPLQPLPPISTMSEKFVYGGHISGGGVLSNSSSNNTTNDDGVGNNASNSSSGEVGPYLVLPTSHHTHTHGQNSHQDNQNHQHHQNSLNSLSLSVLNGAETSSYSSFDKLPPMGMSITPPHNYGSSPSHTLSAMVVSCNLPQTSPHDCGTLSPQSVFSHSSELQTISPSQQALNNSKDSSHMKMNNISNDNLNSSAIATQHREIVRLSPIPICGSRVVEDHVIATGFHSPYSSQQRDLIVATTPSTSSSSHLHIQTHSPGAISLQSVSGCSLPSPGTVLTLPDISSNCTIKNTRDVEGLVSLQRNEHQHVVSLTPSPPLSSTTLADVPQTLLVPTNHYSVTSNCETTSINGRRVMLNASSQETLFLMEKTQKQIDKSHPVTSDCPNNGQQQSQIAVHTQQHQVQSQHQQQNVIHHNSNKPIIGSSVNTNSHIGAVCVGGDIEEINTKELAQHISAELKRYSIPQAIFAQRVLCRSQGTLSDLLRNPKPWSKLKSGRETFRRMFKWLQEPEFQRMSALRMAAAQIPQRGCTGGTNNITNSELNHHSVNNIGHGTTSLVNTGTVSETGTSVHVLGTTSASYRRKDELQMEHMSQPKKPRLVFTDLQRRTLQAIFKETKRPSKEMQVTIARQLGLEPTTVGNFFMNARRRSMDKWRDDDGNMVSNSHNKSHQKNTNSGNHRSQQTQNGHFSNGNKNRNNMNNMQVSSSQHHHYHHTTSLNLDDNGDIDLDLVHDDFELAADNIDDTQQQKDDDML